MDPVRFREVLERSRWTLRDLSASLGVSERTLYRMMENENVPMSLGITICLVLGRCVEDVYGRQDPDTMAMFDMAFGPREDV